MKYKDMVMAVVLLSIMVVLILKPFEKTLKSKAIIKIFIGVIQEVLFIFGLLYFIFASSFFLEKRNFFLCLFVMIVWYCFISIIRWNLIIICPFKNRVKFDYLCEVKRVENILKIYIYLVISIFEIVISKGDIDNETLRWLIAGVFFMAFDKTELAIREKREKKNILLVATYDKLISIENRVSIMKNNGMFSDSTNKIIGEDNRILFNKSELPELENELGKRITKSKINVFDSCINFFKNEYMLTEEKDLIKLEKDLNETIELLAKCILERSGICISSEWMFLKKIIIIVKQKTEESLILVKKAWSKYMKKKREVFRAFLIILIFVGFFFLMYAIFLKHLDEATRYNTLKDIVIPAYSVVITAILSYMIWQANLKSALIAGEMKSKEYKRDNEKIIKAASKIYYSMQSVYEYLICCYKNPYCIRTAYICPDWIDELAILQEILSEKESKLIVDLFRNINVIKEKMEEDDFQEILDEYCKSILIYFFMEVSPIINVSIQMYLKREQKIVLIKLLKLIHFKSDEEIEEIKKFNLKKKWTRNYKNGQTKYEITFINEDEYCVKIYAEDGTEIVNGTDRKRKFCGYMKTYWDGELIEEGTYVDGKLFNGESYNIRVEYVEAIEKQKHEYKEPHYSVVKVVQGKSIIDKSPHNIKSR